MRAYETQRAKVEAIRERERARQDAAASARAKLAALGLTELEIEALLGV